MSENDRESDLLRQRRANFEALIRLGADPYPHQFQRTDTIADLVAAHGARSKEEREHRDADGGPHPGDPQFREGELPRHF